MEQEDVGFLYKTITSLYHAFEAPPRLMQQLWLDDLKTYDRPLALRALRQWARQHADYPPSLSQLCEYIRWSEEDDRRSMQRTTRHTLHAAFTDAGAAQAANPERTPEEASYGQLMVILAARHIDTWVDHHGRRHPKLTRAEMAEQCYAWATHARNVQRWHLADDLDHAGGMWRTWAENAGEAVTMTQDVPVMFDDNDPALAFLH